MKRARGVGLLLLMALAVAAPPKASTELYDVIQHNLLPPEGGCKLWSDVPEQHRFWRGSAPPAGAGSACAQQGRGNPSANWQTDGGNGTVGGMGGGAQGHYIGSYCVSKATGELALCTSGWVRHCCTPLLQPEHHAGL